MAKPLTEPKGGGSAPALGRTSFRGAWSVLKKFVVDFFDHDPFELAAATSYYTLLSLAPLLLIVVGIGSLVFERKAVEGRILEEMRYLIGDQGAAALETVILNVSPEQSGLSIGIGLVALLIGASTVFAQLSTALNKIWGVKPDEKKTNTWLAYLRKRVLSFAMVLAIGFLLMVSLVLSAMLSAAGLALDAGGDYEAFWHVINALASFLVITVLFAMMFKFLPDAKIAWRHVWLGAALTSLLFTFGKQLIGVYLGHASVGSNFGAAGSIVVFTVWIYYASLLVFLGAKITRVHAQRAGDRVVPEEFAHREARPPHS
ncbi:MAG TPA: YihY/virulence factor BrkB family protein [Planctomycetota bacterium]|nr:YihY/virulence factor BrkB family protein [Planctomycetota bacterium]